MPLRLEGQRFWLAVLSVTLLAFAVRVAMTERFVGLDAPPDANAQPDQLDYELFAWRMASGQGMTLEDGTPTARRTPGTSLVLASVYALAGRDFTAGRLWFCLVSALSCVAAAAAARAVRDPLAGLMAAVMVALFPNHAYYAMHFLSESPAGTLTAFATVATMGACRAGRGAAAALAAGGLWGAAGLVRPNLLLTLPLIAAAGLMWPPSGPARARRWRQLAVVALAAGLTLVPLVARNARVMGVATLATLNGATLWGAHNEQVLRNYAGAWIPTSELQDAEHPLSHDEVERDRQTWRYTTTFLHEHVSDLPALELAKLGRFFSPFGETDNGVARVMFAASWIVAATLMIPGVVWAFRRRPFEAALVLAPFGASVLTALIYYGALRFRDVVAANYLVFGAITMSLVLERWWPGVRAPVERS